MWSPQVLWLLLVLMGGLWSSALTQGSFEDADKANEYTDQEFDLRHTIPGEPGVDYPVLSAVPKTSFVCKGRHEGYYADVESRCQAFRICAHTARSAQGFGFLCPNGTLFNQQHFVCDWYRNVNCDSSEQFYDINIDSRVGSTSDMMERVRQMMEYPMKTISKALQAETPAISSPPAPKRAHQSLSKDLSSKSAVLTKPSTDVARKSAITRAQVESASIRGEAVQSEPLSPSDPAPAQPTAEADDIYVNSLGELSSDPGIKFDHTNAHIIAEYPREYHYQKQMNFAERVNAGLNELSEEKTITAEEVMAPDYIKQIRSNKDEGTQLDLVSNINNLLDEVSTDLDPSVSGYQAMGPPAKVKQPFRFLSRGFASQSNSNSYLYNKPKQTPSTVRFTPNEIPIETDKDLEHKLKFNSEKTTTTTTTESVQESFDYAGEHLLIAPTLPPQDETTTTTIASTEREATTINDEATEVSFLSALLAPLPPAPDNEEPAIASIGQTAALTAAIPNDEADLLAPPAPPAELTAEAADKTDVHVEAAKLLLAGVKLTSHDEEKQLRPTVISSTTTTTTPMPTSTETVTEISSVQERIRGYRRFSHQRVKPLPQQLSQSLLRRPSVRPSGRTTTRRTATTTAAATSTTPTTPKPSKTYLERLAASRLRLSRLSVVKAGATSTSTTPTITTTTTSTTASPLSYVRSGAEMGPNKKLAVRNIEKETSGVNQLQGSQTRGHTKATWESVHSSLERFQVPRGNRVYTPATRAATGTTQVTSTPAPAPEVSATRTASSNRGRNRYSNYKTQLPRTRAPTTQRTTTTTSSTTSAPFQLTTPAALSTLAQQISALASNYNQAYSYTPAVTAPQLTLHTQSHTPTPVEAQPQPQPQPHNSAILSSAFLPFDSLTRAIVDDSILQNFKSTQSKSPSRGTITQQNAYRQSTQRVTKPVTSNSNNNIHSSNNFNYVKPATAAAPALSSLTVPPRPQQQQQQQQQQQLPKQPSIVIARAEGQRIQPNSVGNIISSLGNQSGPKITPSNSYVPLGDFLNTKFGQGATTLQQQQQHQASQQQHQAPRQQPQLNFIAQQYQQPQQHLQIQHTQQQPQQQRVYYQTPTQQIYQQHGNPQQQQHQFQQQPHKQQQQFPQQSLQPQQSFQFHQQQQQQRSSIQTIQQPYLTPNIFVPYQQQQQQLPQFPPLALTGASSAIVSNAIGSGRGHQDPHLNVQLPTLPNGLIPSPQLQVAQKRSDNGPFQLTSTSSAGGGREKSFYSGATSYDVGQNSVGRLPNDITELRRRFRRH